MSWSTDLWDKFNTASVHTVRGIEFLEKFSFFVKDRCAIEIDYANRLRKLTKTYDYNVKKIREYPNDAVEFSYVRAFNQILEELNCLAGQHEVIADNLTEQVFKEAQKFCKDAKEERKKYFATGIEYRNHLTNSSTRFEKSKRNYHRAFRESKRASENYIKVDANHQLSRAEVYKAKTISLFKERACEDSKTDYAKQLQILNQAQRDHYSVLMPKAFDLLQTLDKRRIETCKNVMELSAMVEKDAVLKINKHLDNVVVIANTIDPIVDSQMVIERSKSNLQPPCDLEFEDLSITKEVYNETVKNNGAVKAKSSSLKYRPSFRAASFRHTISARGFRKRINIFSNGANKDDEATISNGTENGDDQADRKKLIDKIGLLNEEISRNENIKDSLLSMRQAYEENSSFGDSIAIENQMRDNQSTINQLNEELKKNLVLLETIDSRTSNKDSSAPKKDTNSTIDRSMPMVDSNSQSVTNSTEPESEMSLTNSENSLQVCSSNQTDNSKSSATYRTSNSFNESLDDSVSLGKSPSADGEKIKDGKGSMVNEAGKSHEQQSIMTADVFYEAPSGLPVLSKAKALYLYQAGPEGSISIDEGESLDVIEDDQGDGWTRVRRKILEGTDPEKCIGFVPTSYIAIESATEK